MSELIQLMKYIGEYNDNFKGQDTLKSIDPNGESFSCKPVLLIGVKVGTETTIKN